MQKKTLEKITATFSAKKTIKRDGREATKRAECQKEIKYQINTKEALKSWGREQLKT